MDYYLFTDLGGMEGWVGLVGGASNYLCDNAVNVLVTLSSRRIGLQDVRIYTGRAYRKVSLLQWCNAWLLVDRLNNTTGRRRHYQSMRAWVCVCVCVCVFVMGVWQLMQHDMRHFHLTNATYVIINSHFRSRSAHARCACRTQCHVT